MVLPTANVAEKVAKKSQGVSSIIKYVRLKFNPIFPNKLLDKLIGVDVIGLDFGLLLSKVLSTTLESTFSRNDSTVTIPTKVRSKILKLSKAIKPSSGVETKHDKDEAKTPNKKHAKPPKATCNAFAIVLKKIVTTHA
jgi:hypothetical protein